MQEQMEFFKKLSDFWICFFLFCFLDASSEAYTSNLNLEHLDVLNISWSFSSTALVYTYVKTGVMMKVRSVFGICPTSAW